MKIEIPDDLAKVRADSNKITWVITNLISNALRYIPKNGLISIRAEESNNFVTISVKDNGKGIPLEYQSKIFQKFARVNENESSGTGLGLAICKEIIRAHGGTIWVDSAPGKGSCFYFTIPVM
jgi:NtrC-family two-component system sensor histidine kinase KinB